MAIPGRSFGEPPLSIERQMELSNIKNRLNEIGESKIPAPYWLKNREGVLLTYVADPIKIRGMSKRSQVETYIVGYVHPSNGLLFFTSATKSVEKRSQVADLTISVPYGRGVKFDVFMENYEDYYTHLQKCFNKI